MTLPTGNWEYERDTTTRVAEKSFGSANVLARAGVADPHAVPHTAVISALRSAASGLSDAEAARRLRLVGPNEMRVTPPAGLGRLLVDQLRSMVVFLLATAGAVAFLLGDLADAMAIATVLAINTALAFFTELRARRALAALLRIDVTRATVMRDGRPRDVDARYLVPGDVIQLEAGQMVPADARLLSTTNLQLVEAALTGESIPVLKDAGSVLARETPLADRINSIYKATTVASGRGHALVTATGVDTEVGRIGGLVSALPDEKTPLEHKLDQLGRRLALLAVAAAGLVVGIGSIRGLPLGTLLETALALAVAAVPEGLPAVATITLALGVHRMARRNAIVRRLPAVETLGSVTVVCTDKTGTLTAGEVTATVLRLGPREIEIEGSGYTPHGGFTEAGHFIDPLNDELVLDALRACVLANRADLHREGDSWRARGDPTEIALLVAGAKAGLHRDALQVELPEVAEVPFSSERRWMASVHRMPSGVLRAYAKGASASLLERCTQISSQSGSVPLTSAARHAVLEADASLARRGLRVLALAAGTVSGTGEADLRELALIGVVGMIDPPAPGVRDAIARFRRAGIRTVMITGDQRFTAEGVARELDLMYEGAVVLDGTELDRLDDAELARGIGRYAGFSRITPDEKLRLVRVYQENGEVVAMIGDGINDAAALRKANVGVAMGRRGTDVAKEAAAVVLQDDRFQTIGAAIEQGRVIFDNIRKFVFYLFSCNLAEVLVLLVAGAAGLPLPLLPLQILWLNLVTDTFPALALAAEPGERDVMDRPPRDPQRAILSASFVRAIVWYAALITAATIGAMVFASTQAAATTEYQRTVAFMTLGLAQALHLGTARSTSHVLTRYALTNKLAISAVGLVILLQLSTIYYPPLARILHTVQLDGGDWLVIAIFASLPAVVGQAIRLFGGRAEEN